MDACTLEFLLMAERDEIGSEGDTSKDISVVVCVCLRPRKDEAKKVSLLVFFCFLVKKEQTSAHGPVTDDYKRE